MSSHHNGARKSPVIRRLGRLFRPVALVLVLAAAFAFVGFGGRVLADFAEGYLAANNHPDDPQISVRAWRKAAWQQDDFFSQIRLGDFYSKNQSFRQSFPNNLKVPDRVEAYVWYFLALRPGHRLRVGNQDASDTLDDITGNARQFANNIYHTMSFEERIEARSRLIYILASRGADGYFTLGRLMREHTPPATSSGCICRWTWFETSDSWFARFFRWSTSWIWDYNKPSCYIYHPRAGEQHSLSDSEFYPRRSDPIEDWCPRDTSAGYSQQTTSASITMVPDAGDGGAVGMSPEDNNVRTRPIGSQSPSSVASGDRGGGFGGNSGSSDDDYYDSGSDRVESVFDRDDRQALMFFEIAAQLGHPLAQSYANTIIALFTEDGLIGKDIIRQAQEDSRDWLPEEEFYPGSTDGGIPYSDESPLSIPKMEALRRVHFIPDFSITDALGFRGLCGKYRNACHTSRPLTIEAIRRFQYVLGHRMTGVLDPLEAVRLIQVAAIYGDDQAQDRLGIMYAENVGVVLNFKRSKKWLEAAANQQNEDAKCNLGTLRSVAPDGFKQSYSEAIADVTMARLTGRGRARCELRDLIGPGAGHDRVDGAGR